MTGSVHLIGVCGSGMSALARWYVSLGVTVSGCDRSPSKQCAGLTEAGITVLEGHDASHVEDVDRVVFSAAVPFDHPELLAARQAGIPVLRRSEALAEVTSTSTLLAIAGAHGKTTTTAMTGWILQENGLNPTVMVGGAVPGWGGGFRSGGSTAVVEADEYDRAFLRLSPEVAAVTSFAEEHVECYGSALALAEAFGVFLELTPPGGSVIVPLVHEGLARWARRLGRRIITTGPGGDVHCIRTGGSGWVQEFSVGGVDHGLLPLPGEYNLLNAGTAIALASTMGVPVQDSVRALESFPGVSRRMEAVGHLGTARVFSDYAHHPDEMKAAILGLRRIPAGRIGIVFQPHLFSRTAAQADRMGEALSLADWSLVLPVYPAREDPIPGIDSGLVVDAARRLGAACRQCTEEDLSDNLDTSGTDVIVFMGAGTVDSSCRSMVGAE